MTSTTSPTYRFWGRQAPPQQRAAIRAEAPSSDVKDGVATLRLYSAIDDWGGPWGVSASEFTAALDELDDSVSEIRLHINSPGGVVFDAIAILNALRNHPARVVAVVDGLAASAASFIAAGADELIVGKNTELMIHDALALAMGNAEDLRDTADRLDHLSENIASIYAEKAGGTVAEWRKAMLDETWFSAQEAVDAGLADRLGEADSDVSDAKNRFDLSIFAHAGRGNAPAPQIRPAASAAGLTPPAALASGDTSQEGDAAMFTDEQLNSLRQSVGVPEDADAATILDALTEALDERAVDEPQTTTTTATVPDGMVLMDAEQHEQLVANAAAGREARDEQQTQAREALVTAAVADGRIPPASRERWQNLLAADEGAAQTLAQLAPGTVPLESVGHGGAGNPNSPDDQLYNQLWGDQKTQEV